MAASIQGVREITDRGELATKTNAGVVFQLFQRVFYSSRSADGLVRRSRRFRGNDACPNFIQSEKKFTLFAQVELLHSKLCNEAINGRQGKMQRFASNVKFFALFL